MLARIKTIGIITMAMIFTIAVCLLCLILWSVWKGLKQRRKIQDSPLKQRTVFTVNQQLCFLRLQEALPTYRILAHVSFDALIATKHVWTRNKYRNMSADFVILDEQFQVYAIVVFHEIGHSKSQEVSKYQVSLLELAGYYVLQYEKLPEIPQLQKDMNGFSPHMNREAQLEAKKKSSLSMAYLK